MFGNWTKGRRMTEDEENARKKKDLRKQIKEVNASIIAIETGTETDEYDTTPSLENQSTGFEQLVEEVDEGDDDRTIAQLEKALEDANKELSEANAEKQRQADAGVDEEEEELNEMKNEMNNVNILEKGQTCKAITDRAEQNKCLEELIGLLTTRINDYKTSGDSQILIDLDELLLKFNRLSIEYNNKFIKLTELKKTVKKGVEDENMAKFNKFLSEAQKILNDKKLIKNEIDNIQQQQNEIIIKHKRISDIFKKRREKTNELIRIKRYKNNPRLKLTETNRKRLQAHILKLEGELNILAEKTKLFKGGRTRRMKKNVKKITNKKKTSIKAKTRRIRRRKTCRRRN
jgi:hypothetical protein